MDETQKEEIIKIISLTNGLVQVFNNESSLSRVLLKERFKLVQKIKRRRRIFMAYLLSIQKRCISEKNIDESFWENSLQDCSDEFFKCHLRMSRLSFYLLCNHLQHTRKSNTNYKACISLEKRIAVALFALGSSAKYQEIGDKFGIGTSTVAYIVTEFCDAVWSTLAPIYFSKLPFTRETIEDCVKGFESLEFPQCLGAIDGCHIQIHPPSTDTLVYHNSKGWYSVVLFALVDYRNRFMYIKVGCPGRCHNSFIYEKSNLKQELTNCTLLDEMSKQVGAVNVPVVIIGDSDFSLSERLMIPYSENQGNTALSQKFNFHLLRAKGVVQNAFSELKLRFQRIESGLNNNIKNVNAIVKACCVLHNFLNVHHDTANTFERENKESIDTMMNFNLNVQETHTGRPEEIRQAIATLIDQPDLSLPALPEVKNEWMESPTHI